MAFLRRNLTVFDRSMIEVRLRDGLGIHAISCDLARSPGMISADINRYGGVATYQADTAASQVPTQWARQAAGPGLRMMARCSAMWLLLRLGWFPEQI